jgi:hypothetical protein
MVVYTFLNFSSSLFYSVLLYSYGFFVIFCLNILPGAQVEALHPSRLLSGRYGSSEIADTSPTNASVS